MTTDRLVTALEETWDGIRKLLADVRDEEWSRPTPCTDWDVHDLASHLAAIESQFQGLPQPPSDPPPGASGIDGWTAMGVQARRGWTPDQILSEIEQASEAQLGHVRSLDAEGWRGKTMGPLGETTEERLALTRLMDIYVHLLDLRSGLGRDLQPDAEPTALGVCVDWALDLTPWGAVKKAGLGEGSRVRLALSEPEARTVDVVVEDGRGRVEKPSGEVTDSIAGPAPAYLLLVTGRTTVADAAGGLKAEGDAARRLVEGFRVFS